MLVPDFRGRLEVALDILAAAPPDVLNHNLETVPRLYREARPGADYAHSLELLRAFKARRPEVLTKSGLMLGLGETDDEVIEVMRDLRDHDVDMLTVGQYLQPRAGNLPVRRYVTPANFRRLEQHRARHGVCARGMWPIGPLQLSRRPTRRSQPAPRSRVKGTCNRISIGGCKWQPHTSRSTSRSISR